jgi:DNA-binding MurR/RpiR family transcriptional regulator
VSSDGRSAGVAALVRDRLGELSPAERRVGRALLAAYPSAGLESVARLAERAEVSAPTVVRFANRLGFDGFVGLQQALLDEADQRTVFPVTRMAEVDAADVGDVAGVLARAVTATFAELPGDEVERAVALLADQRNTVVLAGGRFSHVLAEYLALHLGQLRDDVTLLPAERVGRAAVVQPIGRHAVLVVFDFRRYEPATAALADFAAERKARVVLVTDRWLSPIAAAADVVLPVRVDSPSIYDSFVPAMAVVERLVAGVVDASGPTVTERLSAFEDVSTRLGLL